MKLPYGERTWLFPDGLEKTVEPWHTDEHAPPPWAGHSDPEKGLEILDLDGNMLGFLKFDPETSDEEKLLQGLNTDPSRVVLEPNWDSYECKASWEGFYPLARYVQPVP